MTKSGRDPNKLCVLPWKYPGKPEIYNGCANPDKSTVGLWCPTELDSNGIYVKNSGKWGFCKMEDEGGHCTAADKVPGTLSMFYKEHCNFLLPLFPILSEWILYRFLAYFCPLIRNYDSAVVMNICFQKHNVWRLMESFASFRLSTRRAFFHRSIPTTCVLRMGGRLVMHGAPRSSSLMGWWMNMVDAS